MNLVLPRRAPESLLSRLIVGTVMNENGMPSGTGPVIGPMLHMPLITFPPLSLLLF